MALYQVYKKADKIRFATVVLCQEGQAHHLNNIFNMK